MRVRQDVLYFVAQQQALDALAPVRRHDDEVALVLFGGSNHGFGHQVGFGHHGLDVHALGGRLQS